MTFLLSKDDKVFMNFDNGPDTLLKFRPKILAEMGKRYDIEFTEAELAGNLKNILLQWEFRFMKMKEFLDAKDANGKKRYCRQVFRLIQLIISLQCGFSMHVR